MGYNTKSLISGNNPIGASFVTIGSHGCKLSTIVPNGVGNGNTPKIKLQMLSSAGATTNTFSYYKGCAITTFKTDGWYQGTTRITADNDHEFAPGQGLWVNVSGSGISLTSSGEVLFSEVTWPLISGNLMIANPYATNLKVSNITPQNVGSGNVPKIKLQMLSSAGATTNTLSYYKGCVITTFKTDGWYQGTTRITADNDFEFAPGQAVWVNASGTGMSLKMSSGIKKNEE